MLNPSSVFTNATGYFIRKQPLVGSAFIGSVGSYDAIRRDLLEESYGAM
jgi:hypothetical protein